VRKSFEAMRVASTLRELMWALVSELHLAAPGVDYALYVRECRDKFEHEADVYRSAHG
jgi:hypothetical protein